MTTKKKIKIKKEIGEDGMEESDDEKVIILSIRWPLSKVVIKVLSDTPISNANVSNIFFLLEVICNDDHSSNDILSGKITWRKCFDRQFFNFLSLLHKVWLLICVTNYGILNTLTPSIVNLNLINIKNTSSRDINIIVFRNGFLESVVNSFLCTNIIKSH